MHYCYYLVAYCFHFLDQIKYYIMHVRVIKLKIYRLLPLTYKAPQHHNLHILVWLVCVGTLIIAPLFADTYFINTHDYYDDDDVGG